MNHHLLNRMLVRTLILLLVLFSGIMYVDATRFFGMNRLVVNNNLIVNDNLTWNGTQGGPPRGALIFWDATACPTGWTQVTTYNGRFPRGSSTAGTTGGASTHTHTSTHTHIPDTISADYSWHAHWLAGTSDDNVHAHSYTSCGVTDGLFDIFGCTNVYLDGHETGTETHSHDISFVSDSNSGHNHPAGGTLDAYASASGSNITMPAYYNLTICRKW